ncbi:hypothetical protein TWF788_009202 [Orbilia oligospora]|uniref:HTH La-type RNA-binding domain-containing protein n=1 Tax=Orbilia oligospora TaxID=2813651 RepID=A0A7C8KN62_ORBOL|nr:hypothetical protein TWF788_009202 [Orbilia oligospora]
MTSAAPETKKPAFSYAAAASGKSIPTKSGVSTPEESKKPVEAGNAVDAKKDIDTLDLSKLDIIDESITAPKDQTSDPSPQINGATSDTKSSSSVKAADAQSIQGELSNKEDDGRSITSAQEAAGSTTGNDDGDSKSGKETSSDGKTKFKTQNLVDAPIPKQNPWMVRKEAFDRTKAMQAETKKTQPVMNGTSSQDKGSQTFGNDRRHNRQKSLASENKPPFQPSGGRRDGSNVPEKRGAPEATKDGKILSQIEDISRRPTNRGKGQQQDDATTGDVAALPAPPSMTDKSLWPTPEVAQDEEKREKREKEEKEKEREKEKPAVPSARPTKDKWITMAVTPNIIYDTPLPTRGSRGPRGGRVDRGARTGAQGPPRATDTETSASPTEAVAATGFDKSRSSQITSEPTGQNENSHALPRRHANVITRTAEDAAAAVETAAKKDTTDVKKDVAPQVVNGVKQNGPTSEGSQEKERKPSQANDDGAFVGQGVLPPSATRPKADKPTTYATREQNTHNRGGYTGSFSQKQETSDANGTSHNTSRDRPAGRGNFRGGRGDSNSFVNHSSTRFNGGNSIRHHSPPSQINTNAQRQSPQYPSSPSTPQTARSYRGNNSRSHSVTQPQQFGKYGMQNGYPPQSPFVPSPSYYNNPYYNNRGSVSQGVPMHPDYEFTAAVQNVMNQLSYYFSLDNMVKDTYLRSHMDSQGWIFLDIIAGFRKVKEMTKDNKNIVREACIQSPDVEFRGYHPDGRERLRSARNPSEWTLKYEDRDESCRHEGPYWTENRFATAPQYSPYPMYFQGPTMPPMPVAGPTDQQFPPYNGYPPQPHMMPAFIPGQEFVPENGAAYGNGFIPPYQPFAPAHEAQPTNGHPVDESVPQADKGVRSHKKYPTVNEFPDDKIDHIVLVMRKSATGTEASAQPTEGEQTPSLMVTDQLNEALVKLESGEVESQKSKENDDGLVKFYPTSPRQGPQAHGSVSKLNDEVGWFVDPGVTGEEARVPGVTTFTLHAYSSFKNNVLSRRDSKSGNVRELDILYRFYSHFLRKHFNLNIYNEFKSLALEDFHAGRATGIEYLYKFHVFKIQNFPTPDLFFQDFATFSSDQTLDRPPYDKKMVDAVGYSKTITGSTKTRLGRFMQEKNKNFQMWPIHTHHHHRDNHYHSHHGGRHDNHNNHGHHHPNNHGNNHGNSHGNNHVNNHSNNHGANGASIRA